MKDKIRRVYRIFRDEGLRQTVRSVSGYTTNNIHRVYPRSLLGILLNSTRPSSYIWEFDWDICCVLDGCRYDTFEQVYKGESTQIRSVGSTSQTWIPRTFSEIDTSNVAYISANAFSRRANPDDLAYYHLEPVQKTDYGIETVSPEILAKRAINIWRERDQWDVDQIVVHFMQPHVPFRMLPELFEQFEDSWGSSVWKQLQSSDIDRSRFFEAYRDNLSWVLEDGVDPILNNCDARIAMTADHGNAAGEWGYYGHPRNAPVSSVRNVPWATVEGTDEGTISTEVNHNHKNVNLERQLEALGYR
ncbi:hypothetical protein [Halorubrum lipolyticum]|uniref:Sulfatase N-terminal domain-containing protein n=1 Tax=Halorubrum lipolyticum DSM 21995 TaxID=1227482 RepID=M0NL57_9EURY|nr:hypothetical protein [Halorubrum lipolyticum]EMA58521.1 hypothetical protein C469_13080 [Halorubrum lipolyticum DSM 21995]